MRFRRFTSVIICIVMLTGVVSVSASAAQRTPAGMIDIFEGTADFYANNQDAIEAVYQGMMNHESAIDVGQYQVNKDDKRKLMDAVKRTHPELFFVSRTYGSSYYPSTGNLALVKPQYLYTQAEVNTMLPVFYNKADTYLAMVNNNMDQFTKAVVLHDALDLNCTYKKYDADGNECNNYTFMVDGWGVCENYSEVYSYLLAQLGIKSEIVTSESMAHQWMKIKLDGSDYYYNVDITWDDPITNSGSDEPGKVYHDYFLLSDEEFQQDANDPHYDYSTIHASDGAYDNHSALHSLENPLFYLNGELYTLYESNDKGYIATYDHNTDTLTNVLTINDIWYCLDMPGYHWPGNYSGIVVYNGLLYFNGENCVYQFNPATGEKTTYKSNVFGSDYQVYGLYEKDGKLYGMKAASPNDVKTEEYICDCQRTYTVVYNYKAYDEATNTKISKSFTKTVDNKGYTASDVIELNMPSIKSAYLEYSGYTYTESGDTLNVTINDTEKKYTVTYNGTESEHSYLDLVTLNADSESSFIVDGKVAYVGKSYSFYVGKDTTVTTGAPTASAEYTFINLNNVTVTDEKVSLDMLATANVGAGSYQRMGVAFALGEKTDAQISAAVQTVTTGTGTSDKIAVHNSSVTMYNQSGQYQFRYAPYFAKDKANDRTIYFYTYVVTDNGVQVSTAATYDMSNLLA